MINRLIRTHRAALTALVLLTLFVSATPAFAQEGETAATTSPSGIGVLILLMGFAALVAVAGVYMSGNRNPYSEPGARTYSPDEDEDEE
jgi:hypothetical protein